MIQSEMLTLLKIELRSAVTLFTDDELNSCIDTSERETGFSLPTTEDFRIHWVKERAKRACFYMLLVDSAPKFRLEDIHIQQMFEHYKKLIDDLDKAFTTAIEDSPLLFCDVDYNMFGSCITAGFSYDEITGEDTTYEVWNKVFTQPQD